MPLEVAFLRQAYADICRGYSEAVWAGTPIFVRHLNVFDQTVIDRFRAQAFDATIKRGVPCEKDILANLERKKLWTAKEIKELAQEEAYLENLRKTRSKIALKLQADQLDKQIGEANEKIWKLVSKRNKLVGKTAERVADDKTQYEYVRLSFYKDRALTVPLFTFEDMNALSDIESQMVITIYVDSITRFTQEVIKNIAIQPFFTNYFYLCGEELFNFFRRPIYELSIYQVNLLSYAQYYKSILTHHEVPKDIATNPDKIEEFVTRSKNAKDIVAKAGNQQGGRVGIVGATKEDFDAMGVKDSTDTMREVASKQYKSGREGAQDLGFTYND
jgi:hypothetical protein